MARPAAGPPNDGIGSVAAIGGANVGKAKVETGFGECCGAVDVDEITGVVIGSEACVGAVVALRVVVSDGNSRARMVVRRMLFSSIASDLTSSSLSGSTDESLTASAGIEGKTRRSLSIVVSTTRSLRSKDTSE